MRAIIIILIISSFKLHGQIIQEVHNEKGTEMGYLLSESEYGAFLELIGKRPIPAIFQEIRKCLIDHTLSTNKGFAKSDLQAYAEKYHPEEWKGWTRLSEPNLIRELQKLYKN